MGLLRSVCSWLGATGVVVAAGCAGEGCYGATQATLVLDTDVPCATVGQTAITIGVDALETETSPPQANATTCTDGHLGTLVLVPSGARDGKIAIRVVTGPDPSRCTKDNGYQGCIVARRSVRYIEHRSMRLPIVMRESCRDLPCSTATETCVRGRCVPSTIAPERCLGDGCAEDTLLPGPDATDAGVDADAGPEAGDAGCVEQCVGRTRTTCTSGQPVVELCATPCDAGCATVTDIAAGNLHTCALLSNGDVYCWGGNAAQQLGVGSGMPAIVNRPTSRVGLPAPARSLHAGSNHTCVVTRADEAFCWGANGNAQIDVGGAPGLGPTRLSGTAVGGPVVTLAAGATFTCAGTAAGLVCQGLNTSGELGSPGADTVYSNPNVPVLLAAGTGFGCLTEVAQPTPRCWGANGSRQLGSLAAGPVDLASATDVLSLSTVASAGVQQLVAGPDFACALSLGQVFCWGAAQNGQLGNGLHPASSATAVRALVPEDGVVHVAAAVTGLHACAVKSDGRTYCWGQNGSGQLGNPSGGFSSTPVLVTIPPALRVTGGTTHSCALLKNREISCWGRSSSGQLGTGTTNTAVSPPATVVWP